MTAVHDLKFTAPRLAYGVFVNETLDVRMTKDSSTELLVGSGHLRLAAGSTETDGARFRYFIFSDSLLSNSERAEYLGSFGYRASDGPTALAMLERSGLRHG